MIVVAYFFRLARYAQAQADDFDYAVLLARYGFWGSQAKWYQGWNGRYFFNATTTATVALVDLTSAYWIVPTVTILLLGGAHYYAFRRALPAAKPSASAAAAVLATALFLVTAPNRSEVFYWATGVTVYALPISLLPFFLVATGQLFAARTGPWLRALSVGALAFMIIGSNETSMVVLDVFVAGAVAVALIWQRRVLLPWLALLALAAACSYALIKAPGNAVRESFMVARHNVKLSIEQTNEQTKTILWTWSTQPLLLVLTALGWPAAGRAADRARERFPTLARGWVVLAIVAGTAALVWFSIFPSWWSKGSAAIPRTLDVTYGVFLAGWSIGVAFASALRVASWKEDFVRFARLALAIGVPYLFLTHDTFTAVVTDVTTSGPLFRRALRERYAKLRDAARQGERDVAVDPITARPSQLSILDLYACSEGWPNSSYAEYFGVHSVRPRGAPIGSCGPVPAAAAKVVNPYSIHLFRKE